MSKKILGLDIGVASLGWAVTKYSEENKKWEIDDFGVRLWNASEESKTLESKAQKARNFRSQRRLVKRRLQRTIDLKNYFINQNFMTKDEIEEHFKKLTEKDNGYNSENEELNPLELRFRGLNNELTLKQIFIVCFHIAKNRGYENMFSFDSLDNKDSRQGLKFAQDLINKYGTPIEAIKEDEFFKGNWYRNTKTKDSKGKVILRKEKDILFTRQDLKNELTKILDKQIEFNKINEEQKNEILNKIIFRQRYFEDGPGRANEEMRKKEYDISKRNFSSFHDTIGKCRFYPEENRLSYNSIYGDIFFIINELSKMFTGELKDINEEDLTQENFELNEKAKENRIKILKYVIQKYLDKKEFKERYVKEIFEKLEIPYSRKEKGISFSSAKLFLYNLNKNFPNWTKSELEKSNYELNLIDSNSKIEQLGEILSNYMTPKKIIEEIKKEEININQLDEIENEIDLLKRMNKISNSGRFNVSKKYVQDLIDESFDNGIIIGKFQDQKIKENEELIINNRKEKINNPKDIWNHVFNINSIDKDTKSNAVVFRSINQTRIIIRALLKKYNNFSTINIEAARDLYAAKTERTAIRKSQDKFEDYNNKIKIELEEIGAIVNSTNIERLKLFKQQAYKGSDSIAIDFYDINLKEQIKKEDIFTNEYEVDHIYPFSKSSDNTLWNKVLTKRVYNQAKGNRTPIEYFESKNINNKQIALWLKNLKTNFKIFSKKEIAKDSHTRKFNYLSLNKALREEDFSSRDLNDVRYIGKYLLGYFRREFNLYEELTGYKVPKINVIRGMVTSQFRKEWLKFYIEDGERHLNPWGFDVKTRDLSPYHHSVDAIILAQFESYSQIEYYSMFIKLKSYTSTLRKKVRLDKNFTLNDAKEELYKAFDSLKKSIKNLYISNKNEEKINSFIKEDLTRMLDPINKAQVWFNLYPIINSLSLKIKNLVPVQLEVTKTWDDEKNRTIYNVEYKDELLPKDWSRINNRNINEFPYPSYKIERRIRGPITGSELMVAKKEFKEDKHFKDQNGNIWDKSKYIGMNLDDGSKLSRYDILNKKISTTKILSINEPFEFEGKIYLYKGFSNNQIIRGNIFYKWASNEKYKKIYGEWPYTNINKYMNFKKINISKMGKIQ
ncbi:MAG: CRISPR-associated endonuclease Cas9 [Candidatus Tyloplasma litorale]|nr:MAG: CRISPR-associated endonuclease Cas9 [Mycoplasmatales bacterium]